MLRQPPMKGQQSEHQKKLANIATATNAMQGMRQPNFDLSEFRTEPSHYVSFDSTNLTWPKNKHSNAPTRPKENTSCSPTKSQCHLMQSLLPSLQQDKPTTSNKSREINLKQLKVPESEVLQKKINELERRLTTHDLQKQEILDEIRKLKQRLVVNERVYAGKCKQDLQLSQTSVNKSFNKNIAWLNRLKKILSTYGNDFVVEQISNHAGSDSVEAVIYIKRAGHKPVRSQECEALSKLS